MHSLFHQLRKVVIYLLKYVLSIVPKKENLLLFSAWFGKKYADSCMYMYEYLLDDKYFEVYWYTTSKKLYDDLNSRQLPVVYSKSLRGVWIHLRAKMLISAVQFMDFNSYLLTNCILFDLDHGFALKKIHFKQRTMTENEIKFEYLLRKKVDYYMSASSSFAKDVICECYDMTPNKVVFCNKPRIDALFDEELRKGHNGFIQGLKKKGKLFVWMPTHRSDGKVALNFESLLDFTVIQKICEHNNAFFIIKKHFYHRNEQMNLDQYSRIFDITNDNIETQTLLYQADVLISDYSASYIDYLVLNRPIILFAFDLDSYLQKERDLYIKFENNAVGYKPTTAQDFYQALTNICNDWSDSIHANGRNNMRKMYFGDDVEVGTSRQRVRQIIIELISGCYHPHWDEMLQKKLEG